MKIQSRARNTPERILSLARPRLAHSPFFICHFFLILISLRRSSASASLPTRFHLFLVSCSVPPLLPSPPPFSLSFCLSKRPRMITYLGLSGERFIPPSGSIHSAPWPLTWFLHRCSSVHYQDVEFGVQIPREL